VDDQIVFPSEMNDLMAECRLISRQKKAQLAYQIRKPFSSPRQGEVASDAELHSSKKKVRGEVTRCLLNTDRRIEDTWKGN